MTLVRRFAAILAIAAILIPAVAQTPPRPPSQNQPGQQQQRSKCSDNGTAPTLKGRL